MIVQDKPRLICDLCKNENADNQHREKIHLKYFYDMTFGVEIITKGYGANVDHICKSCSDEAIKTYAKRELGLVGKDN